MDDQGVAETHSRYAKPPDIKDARWAAFAQYWVSCGLNKVCSSALTTRAEQLINQFMIYLLPSYFPDAA
jgi:hypothetical protein